MNYLHYSIQSYPSCFVCFAVEFLQKITRLLKTTFYTRWIWLSWMKQLSKYEYMIMIAVIYRIYMEASMKIHKQISRPVSSYNNKKKIFHMISSTFNFEEMCFDRFLHFIFYRFRSFIVIMIIEGWDAVMWKTSPSTNGWFMHVYHTCYITTYSSFSSPSFYFC